MTYRSAACRPLSPGRCRTIGGFTLMELMITVAIVGILAAIAYPAYTNSVIKGKRSQGRTALLDLLTQQERYFTQNNSYMTFALAATGTTGADAAGTGKTVAFKTWSGDSGVANAAYKLRADVCPGTLTLRDCVLLTAEPQFTDTAVQNLTVMSTGLKSCTTGVVACWN